MFQFTRVLWVPIFDPQPGLSDLENRFSGVAFFVGWQPLLPCPLLTSSGPKPRVCGSKPMGSHFEVAAPPILEPILVGIESDVHWGYGLLTNGQV